MNSIIVTGATGVIGMALINKCIADGIYVTALVNPDSNRLDRIPDSRYVRIVKCSIDQYNNMDKADILPEDAGNLSDAEPECFYHLSWAGTFGSARNDAALQNRNVEYTLDAVKLAKRLGCKTFIGVGSQAEYGRVQGMLTKDTPVSPENEYGKAKLIAGNKSRELCAELGMKHIWTRVLSIYGPYDGKDTMVSSTVRALLKGEIPHLTLGEQMWDYLYCKDAANALIMLGDKGVHGNVYPLGSGSARPLREYIEIMRNTINPELKLGFGDVPYADKQVMYLCADISELTKDTGFEPAVSFEDGISDTIEWIRNNYI